MKNRENTRLKRVGVKERPEHVEECGRSMAHNVTPDKAGTEINKLSVSLQ